MQPIDDATTTVETSPTLDHSQDGIEVDVSTSPTSPPETEKAEAQQGENAGGDEEVNEYLSKRANKRIADLTYRYREAERQRDAAVEYAKSVISQNENLRTQVVAGHKVLADTAVKKTDAEIQHYKKRLEEAITVGDAAAQAEASSELGRIQAERQQVQRFAASAPQVYPPQPPAAPQPRPLDEGQQKFLNENPWWGSDEMMTAVAVGKHREFERFNPAAIGNPDYYKAIVSEVKKRFPEKFDGTDSQEKSAPHAQRAGVAPSSRTASPRNGKVTISESQMKVIDRLRGSYSREEFLKRYAQNYAEMEKK